MVVKSFPFFPQFNKCGIFGPNKLYFTWKISRSQTWDSKSGSVTDSESREPRNLVCPPAAVGSHRACYSTYKSRDKQC